MRIIHADPVAALAKELRAEAEQQRTEWHDEVRAIHLERMANRIDGAIEAGAKGTWVPVAAVAELMGKHVETIRVRCRRELQPKGLARKVGADWVVHVDAFAA